MSDAIVPSIKRGAAGMLGLDVFLELYSKGSLPSLICVGHIKTESNLGKLQEVLICQTQILLDCFLKLLTTIRRITLADVDRMAVVISSLGRNRAIR